MKSNTTIILILALVAAITLIAIFQPDLVAQALAPCTTGFAAFKARLFKSASALSREGLQSSVSSRKMQDLQFPTNDCSHLTRKLSALEQRINDIEIGEPFQRPALDRQGDLAEEIDDEKGAYFIKKK